MEILFPAYPQPERVGSALQEVNLDYLERLGIIMGPRPWRVWVQYTNPRLIFSRAAENVHAVRFDLHRTEGIIVFFRAYNPDRLIACPYRSRHIARLTFTPEHSPLLNYKGPSPLSSSTLPANI